MHRLAKIIKDIEFEEKKVLQTLEEIAHRFEYAPLEEIAKKLTLDTNDVLFLLSRLNKIKLVQRRTEPYLGYRLSKVGYDALALHDLAEKDIIVSLGQPYGVGKEATVYRALDAKGTEVAVKFLRWGRTSFRRVRRLRTLKDDSTHSWMDLSKQAADQEYKALSILHNLGGKVPQPIALNRHVIVMSQMIGDLLLQINDLKNPQAVLEQIIQQIHLAYRKAELVHSDLSEYNIFVDENEQIIVFDWPQWQSINHPNALWLLKRDVTNVLKFFKRRFRIIADVDEIVASVTKTGEEEQD